MLGKISVRHPDVSDPSDAVRESHVYIRAFGVPYVGYLIRRYAQIAENERIQIPIVLGSSHFYRDEQLRIAGYPAVAQDFGYDLLWQIHIRYYDGFSAAFQDLLECPQRFGIGVAGIFLRFDLLVRHLVFVRHNAIDLSQRDFPAVSPPDFGLSPYAGFREASWNCAYAFHIPEKISRPQKRPDYQSVENVE
ncbi:MAG: hypothetical protein IKP20_07280 [Candidatus Methanomethylophilaceae archaeon]|nr:hypothetical protein [Candidatus Methanomethylophilaceae archaeon]